MLSFKRKRLSLGLSQTQVGRDLEELASAEKDGVVVCPSYSQSQVCRIERLDITPRQAKALRPVLQVSWKEGEGRKEGRRLDLLEIVIIFFQKWLSQAEVRYLRRHLLMSANATGSKSKSGDGDKDEEHSKFREPSELNLVISMKTSDRFFPASPREEETEEDAVLGGGAGHPQLGV